VYNASVRSISFESMASIYDKTRIYDADCFAGALDCITDRFPPQKFLDLFEPGIGTGRIALELAVRGYRVTGVDVSQEMLDLLQQKLDNLKPVPQVYYRKADVTGLPFQDNSFDICVAVHFFHLIPGWRRAVDEILRVLKLEAPLVLLYTGYGTEIPFLKDRYTELCQELGFTYERAGTKNAGELLGYLERHGRIHEEFHGRWRWTHRMQLGTTLEYMKNRAYSFAALTPAKIHAEAMRLLEKEVIGKYRNTANEVEVPNEIFFILSLPATPAVRKS
jgi:ubiquinone/menaquinone biosynthesis C-methylase UbiE